MNTHSTPSYTPYEILRVSDSKRVDVVKKNLWHYKPSVILRIASLLFSAIDISIGIYFLWHTKSIFLVSLVTIITSFIVVFASFYFSIILTRNMIYTRQNECFSISEKFIRYSYHHKQQDDNCGMVYFIPLKNISSYRLKEYEGKLIIKGKLYGDEIRNYVPEMYMRYKLKILSEICIYDYFDPSLKEMMDKYYSQRVDGFK